MIKLSEGNLSKVATYLEIHFNHPEAFGPYNARIKALGGKPGKSNYGGAGKRFVDIPLTGQGLDLACEMISRFGHAHAHRDTMTVIPRGGLTTYHNFQHTVWQIHIKAGTREGILKRLERLEVQGDELLEARAEAKRKEDEKLARRHAESVLYLRATVAKLETPEGFFEGAEALSCYDVEGLTALVEKVIALQGAR